MSQEYMDPDLLADFFNEAKEHLETIEPNLLQLESHPDDLELLNEIFRPMHSLKGASGFLGLNKINQLAHKAENVLDDLRQGVSPVTTQVMDIILSATDALRTLVENLEATGTEGDVDVKEIIDRIESLQQGEPAAQDSASGDSGDQGHFESGEAASPRMDDSSPAGGEPAAGKDVPARHAAPRIELSGDPDFDPSPYALTTVGEGHLTDFLEEAQDIIEDLNRSLVALEGAPEEPGELINDIFRYFHNLKGNSGIIGFKELNALTHEAETLLNRVRKGEMASSQPLFDLLLAVVDLIEEMVSHVEPSSGEVTPMDGSGMVEVLQRTYEQGEIPDLTPTNVSDSSEEGSTVDAAAEADASSGAGNAPVPHDDDDVLAQGAFDPEDVSIFEGAVRQQEETLRVALAELRKDASQERLIDGMFRALNTIRNSCGYMGLQALSDYASQTASLVDQGRKGGDFGPLLDILDQEIDIISERLHYALERMHAVVESASDSPGTVESDGADPSEVSAVPSEPSEGVAAQEPLPSAFEAPHDRQEQPLPADRGASQAHPAPASAPAMRDAQPAPVNQDVAVPVRSAGKEATVATAPSSSGGSSGIRHKSASTIRVDHHKLDHLMNLIGELIINRNRYALLARALEEGQEEVHEVAQQLTETTYAMARISDDLQDTIMNVRMVPVQTVFSRFPRLVRDLSRKSGKQVELITEGEETELDKSVVEEIGDPLVHLVRNAVDHGLEDEEQRVAVGKNPTGHVWLRAYHKGNSVAIEVEDDGRGIDPEKMRNVAVRKGVLTPEEAANLDDREAVELIFHPGFSSAEKVTDISGRGVGMDVVKTNIKNLKGSVHTQSETGKGTKLTLTLPLTLAIIDALMVEVAGETFAIPLDAVSETTKIKAAKLSDVNSRKAVTLRGEVLGVVELSELLELPGNEEERSILPIVIVHDNDRRVGLVVDRLLERQEIVIKPLGQYLSDFQLDGISGATIMGDGSVVLILDPHEIYSLATSMGRPQARGLERPKLGTLQQTPARMLEKGAS
ncbi:two-component system, chemotaxis family, sensor kinase CheA [Paucidesulfovibrio gracilis DSM 16080]|uniref:Chemotaxis protein CheA n=1 Tax=Paucidesulfovibrio gracilis DSM 16080 TaxID=1121449 RepID=A0A1T4XXB6_9BACT|nr:chemotaxis protein CheA [Paucidesulfovibrio gracilis]SKA94154.1 two-component system, chemotaxis family, sensor kinase CheA [Paucidesulfovibrio gracilis DSM 16080]